MCVCPSVYPSVCASVCPSVSPISPSVCPSVRLFVPLYIRLSIRPSIRPPAYPSVYSVCLSVRLPIRLFVLSTRPSVYPSVYPSVCASVRLCVRPPVRLPVSALSRPLLPIHPPIPRGSRPSLGPRPREDAAGRLRPTGPRRYLLAARGWSTDPTETTRIGPGQSRVCPNFGDLGWRCFSSRKAPGPWGREAGWVAGALASAPGERKTRSQRRRRSRARAPKTGCRVVVVPRPAAPPRHCAPRKGGADGGARRAPLASPTLLPGVRYCFGGSGDRTQA